VSAERSRPRDGTRLTGVRASLMYWPSDFGLEYIGALKHAVLCYTDDNDGGVV